MHYPYDTYTATGGYHETFDIEAVTIIDENIILEFDDNTLHFERTSPTFAVTEDGLWYEFVDNSEQ